jgi:hypothetical protein
MKVAIKDHTFLVKKPALVESQKQPFSAEKHTDFYLAP